jgi:CO/xanthine dehydrogenase FAD-binding subunit
MKPASFEYHRAADCDEALVLLRDLGDEARILAGGQSLVPLMNFRLAQPAHLVSISGIEELGYVRLEDDELAIGAAARQAAVEEDPAVNEHLPILAESLRLVAHPPIRHRGTVCGSIAHADPAAELPALALALGATFVARTANGERRISADDFFRGAFDTALAADELLSETRFPRARRRGYAIVECARTHGNFALAGAVSVVELDDAKRARNASIVVFGACPRPTRASTAAALLSGEAPSEELVAEAAARAAEEIDAVADIHGSASYRRRLARVQVRRSLERAVSRAQETMN